MKNILYPKISIVTPNYNGGDYLEETILSVINQNYPNLEYIIVDGGSTDNSIEIIKKYQNRLAWWISEADNGMYQAIQKGFQRSTGEIMAWINSDDMYHTNALFTVAEIFSSFEQINWLSGTNTVYDEYGRTVSCNNSRMFTKYDFYNKDFMFIQQESTFWRRILWEKTGSSLNTTLKYAGDFELWLRYFQYERLFITQALIGGFRCRRTNQLSQLYREEYLKETEMVMEQLVLTEYDKKIMSMYRNLIRLEYVIAQLKIFRTDWIINRFRLKYFPKPSRIGFDRYKMEYILLK